MRKMLCALCAAFGILACTQDAYDKGEGKYSLMRGDFAEARVNGDKRINQIITDDNEVLPTTELVTTKWIATADTTYRCMLYYNKVETANGKPAAEIISIGQVPCPAVKSVSEFGQEVRTDPVKFESAWLSKSGKYLNLSLLLMTGVTDDTAAVQKLAVIADTLLLHSDNTHALHLRLHHDQGGVPEYYSTQTYLSLPTDSLPVDTVHFSINTYNGIVQKSFVLQ